MIENDNFDRENDYFMFVCPKCGRTTYMTIQEYEEEIEEEECECGSISWVCLKINPPDYDNLAQKDKESLVRKILRLSYEDYIKQKEKWAEYENQVIGVNIEDNRAQQNTITKNNRVSCPYCKSTNVKKISAINRVVSVGLFGLGSGKIGKQFHCNSCKADF